jgi:hypothetical protein
MFANVGMNEDKKTIKHADKLRVTSKAVKITAQQTAN